MNSLSKVTRGAEERGFALVSAVLLVFMASILAVTFMAVTTSERSISSNVHVARGALLASDAGVRVTQQTLANLAKSKLDSLVAVWNGVGAVITNPQALFPSGPVTTSGTNPTFTAGATIVFSDSTLSPTAQFFDYTYTTTSSGGFGAAGSRTVRTTGLLRVSASRGSFADFLIYTATHLTPDNQPIWFTSSTSFNGRVHTNTEFRFANSPAFQDLATSVNGKAWYYNKGNPVELASDHNGTIDVPGFYGGFDRGVGAVTLPANAFSQQNTALGLDPSSIPPINSVINTQLGLGAGGSAPPDGVYLVGSGSAVTGGIYVQGSLDQLAASVDALGHQVYTMRQSAVTKTITVDLVSNRTRVTTGSGTTSYDGVPRGVIYVTGAVSDLRGPDRVAGSPPPALAGDTQVLLTTVGDVVIRRDVTYEDYQNGQNVLGIFSSAGSVRVGTDAPNDMNLDAFVMATGASSSFTVDNFGQFSPRGTFHLRGGMVTSRYGGFGTFYSSGKQKSGFGRDFQYDRRGLVPPYFPTTNRFTADTPSARTLAWKEL